MRTVLGVLVFAALVTLSGDRGQAQQKGLQGGIFWAPNSARQVTLTRDNGSLLASFTFPRGTFLSAFYDDQQQPSVTPGRWEFHGTFELRVALASETSQPGATSDDALPSGAQGFGPRIQQVMSQARLVLTVRSGKVVIANVDQ